MSEPPEEIMASMQAWEESVTASIPSNLSDDENNESEEIMVS